MLQSCLAVFRRDHSTAAAIAAASSAAPAGYVFASFLAALPPRGLTAVTLPGGLRLCLVTSANRSAVHALADSCPHKGARLSDGDIEDTLGPLSVKCPKHRKPSKFPGGFNVRVTDGSTWVGVPAQCHYAYDSTACAAVHDALVIDGSVYVSQLPRSSNTSAADVAHTLLATDSTSGDYATQEIPNVLRTGAPLMDFERVIRAEELHGSMLRTHMLASGPHMGVPVCIVVVNGVAQSGIYDVCPHKQAQVRVLRLSCIA